MNILYELDNNFAPQVCTSMVSVCENNLHVEDLHFYIFGLELSEEVKRNLVLVGKGYKREVTLIAIDGFMEEFGDFDTFGWNEVVLSRLLVNKFLPQDVDRVLHLDGDTIVRGRLDSLWTTTLGPQYIIGAVIEPTVDRQRISGLGLAHQPYFNAGVLLIDLAQWRADGIEQSLLTYCRKNHEKLFANDQDAINVHLTDRIKCLAPTFNYCNTYEFYPYKTLCKLMDGIPYYTEEQVRAAMRNPTIVHFLGEERPWREGSTHTYTKDYKYYLSLTPYASMPDDKGWSTYFLAWKVFNIITKPIPMMRYKIITALIPKVLAIRKNRRQ